MLEGARVDRPQFLASVTNAEEALAALAGGADVIDAKDPASGALGRLSAAHLKSIVAAVAGRAPVSATAGDLVAEAAVVVPAVCEVAATGVDIVKVGLFGDGDMRAVISALGELDLRGARLVAVVMADQGVDFSIIAALANAGFAGVMLDTAAKNKRGLRDHASAAQLCAFVAEAQAHGLFAGLAGSLSISDVAPLCRLAPDVLGFRGALCADGRASPLIVDRVRAVRHAIDAGILAQRQEERAPA